MSITNLVVLFLGLGVVYVVLQAVARAYRRYRGKRLVVCPETKSTAAVEVDTTHAVITAAFGETELRLRDCSRWPERRACGQECLKQIETAPGECLVRSIADRWYADKRCVLCRKPAGEVRWLEHPPALLGPDGTTLLWKDIAPEKLPGTLTSHQPVCWNCHIAEAFRRQHPELVVDRGGR